MAKSWILPVKCKRQDHRDKQNETRVEELHRRQHQHMWNNGSLLAKCRENLLQLCRRSLAMKIISISIVECKQRRMRKEGGHIEQKECMLTEVVGRS